LPVYPWKDLSAFRNPGHHSASRFTDINEDIELQLLRVFLAVRGVGDHDSYQLGISLTPEEKQKGKGIPRPYLQKECWKLF
jgi:hypothetical protein